MKLYSFNKEAGRDISAFHSNFIMSRIVQMEQAATIGCIYLPAGGIVGYHQAASSQLLLIVAGQGWVRAKESAYVHVQAGDAVFWQQEEWHETKTDSGLTAILIESDNLEPSPHLTAK